MTYYSKFSSVSFNQVVKPQTTQRLEVRNKNSAIDKENVNASPPVCLKFYLTFIYLTKRGQFDRTSFAESLAQWLDLFVVLEAMEKYTKPRYWLLTAAKVSLTVTLNLKRLKPRVSFSTFLSVTWFFHAYLLLAKLQPVSTPLNPSTNERVRKSPPHTASADTTVTIKRPKTDTSGSRGRTRISDFDDLTKSLTEEAISIYQAQIVAVLPWPSTAENWESISQVWIEVCGSRNVRIELDDEIFKVVRTSPWFP